MKHSEAYYRRKAKRELIKYFLIFLACIGLYLVLIIALMEKRTMIWGRAIYGIKSGGVWSTIRKTQKAGEADYLCV